MKYFQVPDDAVTFVMASKYYYQKCNNFTYKRKQILNLVVHRKILKRFKFSIQISMCVRQ